MRRPTRVFILLSMCAIATVTPPAPCGAVTPASSPQVPPGYWPRLHEAEAALRADPVSLQTGARYRQIIMTGGQYDRAITLLRKLADQHPRSVEAHMNLAFACIDKVPVSGKIRQALLGKEALDHFTKSIDIRPTAIAYFCRGLVNLFYDVLIFNRVRIGVADLERALELQAGKPPRPYHARVYISLGDGFWKLKNLARAKAVWSEGLSRFPDNADLQARVTKTGKDLEWTVRTALDPDNRVDTSLREIWTDLPQLGLR